MPSRSGQTVSSSTHSSGSLSSSGSWPSLARRSTELLTDAGPGSVPQSYDLKLYFAELANLGPGERIFDVQVQGKTALEQLDVAGETGGTNRVLIKEVKDVEVREFLRLDLQGQGKHRAILNGIEISPTSNRDRRDF